MLRITMKSFLIAMIVAFLTGITGLIYGYCHLSHVDLNWYFPENLINKRNFIAVGSMHNFSYVGGLFGLIAGVIYSIYNKGNKQNKTVPDLQSMQAG